MARRKKGGGRYTPKATRPMNWDNGNQSSPGIDLRNPFGDRPKAPSGLVALLEPIRALPGQVLAQRQLESLAAIASYDDEPQVVPDGTVVPMREILIDMLSEHAPDGQQAFVDALHLLSLYGAEHAAQATEAVRASGRQPSDAVLELGTARVLGGHYVDDERGDSIQYAVEVGYASGQSVMVLLALAPVGEYVVEVNIAKGDRAELMEDLGSYRLSAVQVDAADVRAHLAHALVASAETDWPGTPESREGFATFYPFLEMLSAGATPQPMGLWSRVDLAEADAVADACVDWWLGEASDVEVDAIERWIDFALSYTRATGGGWYRLSTARVHGIWGAATAPDAGLGMPMNRRELESFAVAMPLIIRWAHHRAGWEDRWLDAALAVSQDMAEEHVGLRPGEPDPLPDGLDERTATIARHAGASALRAFDAEMASIAQRLVMAVAEQNPDVMARGKPEIWGSGAVYAAAQLNKMFDLMSSLSIYADELVDMLDGAQGTIASKARTIRETLGVYEWDTPAEFDHSARHDVWKAQIERVGQLNDPRFVDDTDDLFDDDFSDLNNDVLATRGVLRRNKHSGRSLVLRISIEGIEPKIWRQIAVGEDVTLNGLHFILQVAFGWQDCHLHSFEIGQTRYESDESRTHSMFDEHTSQTGSVTLADVVDVGDTFRYVYDFGDNWQHTIEVVSDLDVGTQTMRAVLLGGENAGPPEDVGGTWGFAEFCEALADPKHPEHRSFKAWAPAGYDPRAFDESAVGGLLADLTFMW